MLTYIPENAGRRDALLNCHCSRKAQAFQGFAPLTHPQFWEFARHGAVPCAIPQGVAWFRAYAQYKQSEGTAMNRMDAIAWTLSACAGLRLSQAKTLSDLVAATLEVGRVSLAEIGRRLAGPVAAKHRIKRVWRFTSNQRVEISDAMRRVVARLAKRRRKPVLITFDWTDIRGFCTLMAAAAMKGRAVPLLWASYPRGRVEISQNNLEEGLLRLLRTMIPEKVPVILLADRGFGRTELARTCQLIGFHYVIRITPDVWVENRVFCGKLLDFPVRRGPASSPAVPSGYLVQQQRPKTVQRLHHRTRDARPNDPDRRVSLRRRQRRHYRGHPKLGMSQSRPHLGPTGTRSVPRKQRSAGGTGRLERSRPRQPRNHAPTMEAARTIRWRRSARLNKLAHVPADHLRGRPVRLRRNQKATNVFSNTP